MNADRSNGAWRGVLAAVLAAVLGLLAPSVQAQVPASRTSPAYDFDGGGKSDILWRNLGTGENYIYLMDGTTVSAGSYITTVPPDWNIVGTGDFDGDGKSDILWRNNQSGLDYIYLMNGVAVSSSGFIASAPSDWKIVATGDFNGDGKTDILWRNSVTGEDYLFVMNGLNVTAEGYLPTVPVEWIIAGTGDFNGDGKADILWRNNVTGENYIHLMNGFTIAQGGYLPTVPATWKIAATGDFNADGKTDILWRSSAAETYVYMMNGLGVATSSGYVTAPDGSLIPTVWKIAATGDYDGDGKADILWRNSVTGDNFIYLMDGLTIKPASGFTLNVPLAWLPMPNRPPLVSLTAPAHNSVATAGAQVTLSAAASAGDAGRSLEQVQFWLSFDGGAAYSAGSVTAGTVVSSGATVYSLAWTPSLPGPYSLTARALDDLGAATTSSARVININALVNTAPTINITSPVNNASIEGTGTPPSASLTLTAHASDNVTVASVQFFNGTTPIGYATQVSGSATNGWWSLAWNNIATGSYTVTARATDNQGAFSVSPAVGFAVTPPATQLPAISITAPTVGQSLAASGSPARADVTLTANAVKAQVGTALIASVRFYSGASLIETAALTGGNTASGSWSLVWPGLAPGSYAVTAQATDTAGGTVTSAALGFVVTPGTAPAPVLYFIEPDHLNTPRRISNQLQQPVWKMENTEPFGASTPNENPSALGAFTFPLRFPGQYADKETGLSYNYFRDYNSIVGGYLQSDPIGVALYKDLAVRTSGSIGLVRPEISVLVTSKQVTYNHLYGYVGSSPLSYGDPLGLFWPIDCYKCNKNLNEVEEALKACRKEYGDCGDDLKKQIEFIEKYGGSGIASAIYNCATQANPTAFGDMITFCGKCGVNPKGPWPQKK